MKTMDTRFILLVSGITVAVIGFSALIGYWLAIPVLVGWGGLAPMAINTATAFIITGASIVTIASYHKLWR